MGYIWVESAYYGLKITLLLIMKTPQIQEGYVNLLGYRIIKITDGNQYQECMMPFEINICRSRVCLSESYVT